MTSGAASPLRRAESAVAGAVIAIAVLGLALLPLISSPVVAGLVGAVGSAELTGLGSETTLEAAEAVRVFVLHADAPELPAKIAGRPAFDNAAVSHLIDVRRVLVPALWLATLLGVSAAVWCWWRLRTPGGRPVAGNGLRVAGRTLLLGAGLAVLVGVVDFDAFFTWFHGLFFEPGTWTFPYDSLLIQVFPLPFWMTASAMWGGLVLMSAVALIVNGRRLCFTRGTHGV